MQFPGYKCICISPMNPAIQLEGRPYGGCAILYDNKINCKITPIKCKSNRIIAILLSWENFNIMIINVYMPYDTGCFDKEFKDYNDILNEISSIFFDNDVNHIIIGGDMNTDFSRNNPHSKSLDKFCNIEKLYRCLKLNGADVPYTFCSKANQSYSTIDNFFVTENICNWIEKYYTVFNHDDFSDHFPVRLCLKLDIPVFDEKCKPFKINVDWDKCTEKQINEYKLELNKQLSEMPIEYVEFIACKDHNCKLHNDDIICYCKYLISSIMNASDKCLPKTKKCKKILGWNEYRRTGC